MNSWDFSWIYPLITWLMYVMIVSLVVSMIVAVVMKLLGMLPKKNDPRKDNQSLNRAVFKDMVKAAKVNRIKRIKHVYTKPSMFSLPNWLGYYAGHIADPRMLILRIKRSRFPFARSILLFVPYQLLPGAQKKGKQYMVTMPLTTKNIELYIEDVDKKGYWWSPKVRLDSSISQEVVDSMIASFLAIENSTRYNVQELPAEILKGPVYGASTSPEVERRIQFHMPVSEKEEEKEVPE